MTPTTSMTPSTAPSRRPAGGTDRVYASVNYTLEAGREIETLSTANSLGTEAINLTGNALGQNVYGNAGVNVLDGLGGADYMAGYGGNDSYFVDNALDRTIEAADGGTDRVYASVNYTLEAGREIETLSTANSLGAETINLTGNALGQSVYGNAGANVLNGGGGADVIASYGGTDIILFNTALGPSNIDTINDFAAAGDTIHLENAVFTALTTPGALGAESFFIGAAAHDADDRIIYYSGTDALLYDADGNGAGAAIQFATLSAGPGFTHADFVVV